MNIVDILSVIYYNDRNSGWCDFNSFELCVLQVEDYEEEPLLRTGCKEYFWLLCKLIDNIHVKDASQVGQSH